MEKSIAVLGLGKFGKSLARNLYELGADVLVADGDDAVVSEFTACSTAAICANLTKEEEVLAHKLDQVDIAVVTMGSNLAASILCVSVAKEKGVPLVIAKSESNRMTSILKKVGADRVINPEEEGGARSANILVSNYFHDCFKLDDNLMMLEMSPKEEWIGKSLDELNLRKTMNINVIALKENDKLWNFVDPTTVLDENCLLLIAAEAATLKYIRGN